MMKYLHSFKLFESIDPYSYKEVDNKKYQKGSHFEYHFTDEIGNEFKAELEKLSPSSDEVEFRYLVKDSSTDHMGGWSYKIVKTNLYKLMNTIFKSILPEFCKNNEWCKCIKIVGLSKDDEQGITQRTKLYWRYLTQNPIDGWELDKTENEIYLNRK